jgi:hypothetical protein
MANDKSAVQRAILQRQILDVETKEQDFKAAQKSYTAQLETFGHDMRRLAGEEYALDEALGRQNAAVAQRELEAQDGALRQYVQGQLEDTDALAHQVRARLEKQADKLVKERNQLPWA